MEIPDTNLRESEPQNQANERHDSQNYIREIPPVVQTAKKPSVQRRKLRWDPVFTFPPAEEVMKALYQTETSPWALLSLKSGHREKLRERYGENKSVKHILQRMKAPSFNSIPSIHDKHASR